MVGIGCDEVVDIETFLQTHHTQQGNLGEGKFAHLVIDIRGEIFFGSGIDVIGCYGVSIQPAISGKNGLIAHKMCKIHEIHVPTRQEFSSFAAYT